MRDIWLSAVMLAGLLGLFLAGGTHREAPLVGHQKLTNAVSTLEASVARNPGDATQLTELCNTYLERGAAGSALAAIHRAPPEVQQRPEVSHLWARALLHGGQASQALDKERATLESCSSRPCAPWILASAMRQEAFLHAMVSSGIEDYRRDPEGTMAAYKSVGRGTVSVLDAEEAVFRH